MFHKQLVFLSFSQYFVFDFFAHKEIFFDKVIKITVSTYCVLCLDVWADLLDVCWILSFRDIRVCKWLLNFQSFLSPSVGDAFKDAQKFLYWVL